MSALNTQVAGDHYRNYRIQPVQFIHANQIPFIEGSCIKYLVRWRDKGGVADLEKVKHYVDLLIELDHRENAQLVDAAAEPVADSKASESKPGWTYQPDQANGGVVVGQTGGHICELLSALQAIVNANDEGKLDQYLPPELMHTARVAIANATRPGSWGQA